MSWLVVRAGVAQAQPAPEPTPPPDLTVAPEAAPDPASEVIQITERWLDADLFTVGHTSRASTRRPVMPRANTAVLGDVLEELPGVAVQRTGPGQGAPIIRGLIGSAVLVVVDGMRLNNAIFRPAPNQYTALVDPWAVARVEVTRGPGSALFGSDAVGGVVNLITPLPRFDGDEWQARHTVIAAVASADRSAITRASTSVGRRGSGASVGATLQRHHDLRTGGGDRVVPSAYDSVAVDLTGHLESGRKATTAWLQYLEQPSLPRSDELIAGFGQTEPGAAVFRYEPSRRSFAHVRHLVRRPVDALDGLELHAAWQRVDDDRRIRDTGSDEELVETNQDDSVGIATRAKGQVLGGELIFGVDYWLDRVVSKRLTRDVVGGTIGPSTGRFATGSMMHQLGAFGEGHRPVGKHVMLRAGLRAGFSRLDVPVADREVGVTLDSPNWAGELGAEVTIAPDVALVANLGRAFRSPNVHDLSGLGPRPGNRFQVPAASLIDEQAVGADVGVRVRRERIDSELFGFAMLNDRRIEVIPTGEMTADGREIVVSANTAEARMLGLEGALRLRPSAALELAASTTWIHGRQRTTAGSEPADRVPPLAGRLSARWLVTSALAVDVAVRGAASQSRLSERDRTDPRIDPAGTPAFVTFHLGALVKLRSFEIGARVDNVLDRRYREHGSGTEAPGFDLGILVRWTSGAAAKP